MKTRPILFFISLLAGTAFVVATGGLGKGMSGQGGLDFTFIFIAGKTWWAGFNAYDFALRHVVVAPLGLTADLVGPLTQNIPSFAYPPNIFPLAATVASFDFEAGKLLMKLISLVSALAMVGLLALNPAMCRPGSAKQGDSALSAETPWWLPLVVLGSPFCAHVLWQGQTSLVASAAILAAWFFHARRSMAIAGVMLGLALIKPQLSAYFALWFLLQREWKLLLCAAATVLLCALPALCMPDAVTVVNAWLADIAIHRTAEVVQPGFRHLMGVQSLLWAAGLRVPNLFLIGAAFTVLVWYSRHRLGSSAALSMLIALVFLFSFVQDYDLVLVAPALVYVFLAARGSPFGAVAALAIVCLLAFPMRLVEKTHISALLHYRTAGIALLAAVVLWQALNRMPAVPIAHLKEAAD